MTKFPHPCSTTPLFISVPQDGGDSDDSEELRAAARAAQQAEAAEAAAAAAPAPAELPEATAAHDAAGRPYPKDNLR
jgi:hypothetical protein